MHDAAGATRRNMQWTLQGRLLVAPNRKDIKHIPGEYVRYAVLLRLRRQVFPVAFTNASSLEELPGDARAVLSSFIQYVTELEAFIEDLKPTRYFMKPSLMRLRRYGTRYVRVYIPDDAIVVIRRGDLTVSVMPSETGAENRYISVREGGETREYMITSRSTLEALRALKLLCPA